MGQLEAVQGAVRSLFAVLGNVRETVVYTLTAAPVYDPTTGASATPTRRYAVKGIFTGYKREEIDGTVIRPEDMRFVCERAGFPCVPKLNDWIERGKEKWIVQRISSEPAAVHWDFQLRRGEK